MFKHGAKSKALLIGSVSKLNSKDYTTKLHLCYTDLNFVDEYKYLGITLVRYMTFISRLLVSF